MIKDGADRDNGLILKTPLAGPTTIKEGVFSTDTVFSYCYFYEIVKMFYTKKTKQNKTLIFTNKYTKGKQMTGSKLGHFYTAAAFFQLGDAGDACGCRRMSESV